MDLFGLILDKYKYQREKYSYLMSNKNEIDKVLSKGASKALDTASAVLKRVKTKLGY
jgi:tryptophanyl-tRNA synthetase